MVLCPESFPSPLSSTKWGSQGWRQQFQLNPCKSSTTPYVLQRSRWKTSARKLLGHTDRACVPATTSGNSLQKLPFSILNPVRILDLHLLKSCFRFLSSGTDTLLISKSWVFTGSLNPFLDLFVWIWFADFWMFLQLLHNTSSSPGFFCYFPRIFFVDLIVAVHWFPFFCLQYLAQFHLEDFRSLFLMITIILNHLESAFQCLSNSNSLALFRHLLAAFPSPSSILPRSGQTRAEHAVPQSCNALSHL